MHEFLLQTCGDLELTAEEKQQAEREFYKDKKKVRAVSLRFCPPQI